MMKGDPMMKGLPMMMMRFSILMALAFLPGPAFGQAIGDWMISRRTGPGYSQMHVTPVDGQVLSSNAQGNAVFIPQSGLTLYNPARGNLLVGNGAAWTVLGSGPNGQVLMADSAQTAGLKWSIVSAGDMTKAVYDPDLNAVFAPAQGGTGESSLQAAINSLMASSGALVAGDLFVYNGTNVVRFPAGSSGLPLIGIGAGQVPGWGQLGSPGIADGAITLAKVGSITGPRVLGRESAGSGPIQDLTPAQVTALLNTFTTALKGLVPAPVTAGGFFLRDDGTWAAAGVGNVTKVGTPVDNQVGVWTGDGTIEGDPAFTFDTATDALTTGVLNLSSLLSITAQSAGVMQLGLDSASPTGQIVKGPDARAGTDTNTEGGLLTFQSGAGTGTGAVSSLIFQTPTVGGSGTAAQPQAIRLTLSSAAADFTVDVTVPTEVYDATGWNGDLSAPTKDAVRDKIESMTRTGVRRTVYINAGAMIPRATTGAAIGTFETASNKIMLDTMDFDSSIEEYAGFWWTPPSSWNVAAITLKFHWTAGSGSGTVKWDVIPYCYIDGSAIDATGAEQSAGADTFLAANLMHITSTTPTITVGGTPTANRPIYFQIARDTATDTLNADARLLGATIEFTESTTEPAAQ
jgi:hypothetical protein